MTDVQERAVSWIVGDDTGSSSKCLWGVMMGTGPDRWKSHPVDGGDLGRCLRLLAAIPEWRPRLSEMGTVSASWAALVAHWDELEALHAEDDGSLVYKRMCAILDPIREPGVVRLGKNMTIQFGA